MGYGLDGPGSIPGGARFFFPPQRPDRFWGPPSLLSNGYGELNPRGVKQSSGGVNLTTHLHLVPRPRKMELYLHSPICLHGILLNWLSTGTLLFSYLLHIRLKSDHGKNEHVFLRAAASSYLCCMRPPPPPPVVPNLRSGFVVVCEVCKESSVELEAVSLKHTILSAECSSGLARET
jgi:hypothetical protein